MYQQEFCLDSQKTEFILNNLKITFMEILQKPVWSEGTLLSQQHFQQWDLFLEHSRLFQLKMLQPYFWGLLQLEIDEVALLTDRFRIKTCTAIFPNGRMVTFNTSEHGELCLELNQPHNEITEIFLCTPLSQHIQGLSGYDTPHDFCAFKTQYKYTLDQYDHCREREVAFAIPNLCLLDHHQNREQYTQIKIALLERNINGQNQCIKQFIPSTVHISANSALTDFLQCVLDLLSAKTKLLTDKNFNHVQDASQLKNIEFIHFLLLQTLNQFSPVLKDLQQKRFTHPWELYQEIVRLLGGLSVFPHTEHNLKLPFYDHNNLTEVFHTLKTQLQYVLGQTLPLNVLKLDLIQHTDSLYLIDQIDHNLFIKHDFYLAVKIESDDLTWIHRFLQQVKIACQTDIQAVIGSAVPTITLKHIQRPQDYLPSKNGYEYFCLNKQNEYWQRIKETGNLALFISYEFTDAQFEILAIKK
jgi:type VI secretion system protein ImpJ